MNFVEKCFLMLTQDEGKRVYPYDDKTGQRVHGEVGCITIGIGRSLESKPLSEAVIQFMFEEDVGEALEIATSLFSREWESIQENRQLALVNMIFNLGDTGFGKFRKLIEAVRHQNWPGAALEAENSPWFHQVGDRGRRIVKMLKENTFPYDSSGVI